MNDYLSVNHIAYNPLYFVHIVLLVPLTGHKCILSAKPTEPTAQPAQQLICAAGPSAGPAAMGGSRQCSQ